MLPKITAYYKKMRNFAIEYNFAVPCPPSDSKFIYPTLMISDDDLVCYFDMTVNMTKRKKCQFLINPLHCVESAIFWGIFSIFGWLFLLIYFVEGVFLNLCGEAWLSIQRFSRRYRSISRKIIVDLYIEKEKKSFPCISAEIFTPSERTWGGDFKNVKTF